MIHFIKKILMAVNLFDYNIINKFIILHRIGKLLKNNKCKRFKNRYDLYNYIFNNFIFGDISYLEFGVYKGESLKKWLSIDINENSRFYGFDTFEGLPEDWNRIKSRVSAGTFSTEGKVPDINDKRVQFIKGLFQDTLGKFLKGFTNNKQIILHCDADLFSSTLFVLTQIDPFLKNNDIIIFDEFSSGDEYMAFKNYVDSYRRKYEIIGIAGKSFQQVAIKIK